MTAPDPTWVEAGVQALGADFVDPLAVEAVVAAVEPLIRADEREQVGRVWAKREDLRDAARAEVERVQEEQLDRLTASADRLRAEYAALRADAAAFKEERDAARAEVAALRKQEWAAPYRREVLADLRTKVDECSTIGEVIALIEEAGQ